MNIHEYQGKQIFARYGIPVSQGIPAFTVDEAVKAAEKLIAETKNEVVVVKAQIHAGGRGKGGGVKVAKGGAAEAKAVARKILGMQLVTHQTGPEWPEGAPALHRAGPRHRSRALPRHGRRSRDAAHRHDGLDRGRHGHRGGGRTTRPRRSSPSTSTRVLGLAPYQAREARLRARRSARARLTRRPPWPSSSSSSSRSARSS